jgi:hypothetical protein
VIDDSSKQDDANSRPTAASPTPWSEGSLAEDNGDPTASPSEQPFKTAKQLGIPRKVRDALTDRLEMLKRGELVHATRDECININNAINMARVDCDLEEWLLRYFG